MKKLTKLLALFGASAMMLTGCNEGQGSSSEPTSTTQEGSSSSSESTGSSESSSSSESSTTTEPTSESSESSSSSSGSSSSTSSSESSSSTSSSESSSSSTSTPEPEPGEEKSVSELYGTYAAFSTNYNKLFATPARKMNYIKQKGFWSYIQNTVLLSTEEKISIKSDEDEYRKDTIFVSDGTETGAEFVYASMDNNEIYEIEYELDGSYNESARFKIGTPDARRPDVLSAAEGKEEYDRYVSNNSIKGDLSYVDLVKLHTSSNLFEVKHYDLIQDGEKYYLEMDEVEYSATSTYFGYQRTIELTLDAKGNMIDGYFKKAVYYSDNWDSTNHAAAENAKPASISIVSISSVSYEDVANTSLITNKEIYFATSASGIRYARKQFDEETATTSIITSLAVGEVAEMKNFQVESTYDYTVTVLPKTQCDIRYNGGIVYGVYIISSSNTSVINFVENGEDTGWTGLAKGSTQLTLGNSFNENIETITLTVA